MAGGPGQGFSRRLLSPAEAALTAAKKAQLQGKTRQAQDNLNRAAAFDPRRGGPAWLGKAPPAGPARLPMTREELLRSAQGQPVPEVRGKLEEFLSRHPADAEVRAALLEIATREGDAAAVTRHRSILDPGKEGPNWGRTGWKLLAVVFLLALAVAQAIFLFQGPETALKGIQVARMCLTRLGLSSLWARLSGRSGRRPGPSDRPVAPSVPSRTESEGSIPSEIHIEDEPGGKAA